VNKSLNCLVLGAAGFIGQHLCRTLVLQGYQVRGFDRSPVKGVAWPAIDGVVWQSGDFSQQEDLYLALADIDIVFHLISTTIPKTSNEQPSIDLQQNVAATLGLLDQLVRLPALPRLIFISSGGTVYGIPCSIPINEGHATNPLCAYGVGKLAIEKYIALYHHLYGLDYLILRLANPYGEQQLTSRGQGVIPVFLSKALRGEPLEIWGDGHVIRDYLYIDDLCRALLLAADYAGAQRIFNIGSGQGFSLNDLIEMMRTLLKKDILCRYLPGRACDVPVNVLDVTLARQHLGWQPTISLEAGLARTLAWLQALKY